jgi:glycosyltransferase involved in cell wall biosynthesis
MLSESLKYGGQQHYILQQVKYLNNHGFEIYNGFIIDGELRKKYNHLKVPLFQYLGSLKIYERKLNGYLPFINIVMFINAVRRLLFYCTKNKIQVIQVNGVISHLIGDTVGKLLKIPTVYNTGNIMSETEKLHYKFFKWLPVSYWTNVFITSLNNHKEELQLLGVSSERIFHLESIGVDIKKFHPNITGEKIRAELGIPTNSIVVGQAGRLFGNKRFDYMLEMANEVIREEPTTVFLVVGDGPEEIRLHRLAKKLGIEKSVVFTGARNDIPQVMAATDIAVFTMDEFTGGRTNWEAMASGKPVVSTKNLLVEHERTGLIAPAHNAKEFAATVLSLIKDYELRKQLGKNARQVSEEKYDFNSNYMPQFEKMIKKLSKRSKWG